jgi:hypothetical protein
VKFGERGKSSGGRSKTLGFKWGLTVPLTKGLPQVCVNLIKRVTMARFFEVMTQVDRGLTIISRFDSTDLVISINDAN